MAGQEGPSGETWRQFGQPLGKADEGVEAVGQGRAGAGESRYVDDPDNLVRVDHHQPRVAPPPAEEASEASEKHAGKLPPPSRSDAPDLPVRPDPVTQTPPGPSAWEARLPGEE
jgi:hypothetical protein